MKVSEFRKLIREEISKALNEAEGDIGSEVIDKIVKKMSKEVLDAKRAFQDWAKSEAAKKNFSIPGLRGSDMISATLGKLGRKNILNPELVKKWKQASPDSPEGKILKGLQYYINDGLAL